MILNAAMNENPFSKQTPSSDPTSRAYYHFVRNQKISDSTVKKSLNRARTALHKLYHIEAITATLREQSAKLSSREKATYFNQIKVECISRAISALYLCNLSYLIHRVEINIIGRNAFTLLESETQVRRAQKTLTDGESDDEESSHWPTASTEQQDINFAFLSSTRYLLEDGAERIAQVVTRAVEAAASQLEPQHPVTYNQVAAVLEQVVAHAHTALLEYGQAVETILPEDVTVDFHGVTSSVANHTGEMGVETLDNGVSASSPEAAACLANLLNETRDYLDSPQFAQVASEVMKASLNLLLEGVKERFEEAQRSSPTPITFEETSVPFAKLFAWLSKVSSHVLGAASEDQAYMQAFASNPVVEEFCLLVFAPEGLGKMEPADEEEEEEDVRGESRTLADVTHGLQPTQFLEGRLQEEALGLSRDEMSCAVPLHHREMLRYAAAAEDESEEEEKEEEEDRHVVNQTVIAADETPRIAESHEEPMSAAVEKEEQVHVGHQLEESKDDSVSVDDAELVEELDGSMVILNKEVDTVAASSSSESPVVIESAAPAPAKAVPGKKKKGKKN